MWGPLSLLTLPHEILYHLNIQLFTTLCMWQGGPQLYFILFYFFKKKTNSKASGGPPCHIDKMVKSYVFR
jgi:hypothetical protein